MLVLADPERPVEGTLKEISTNHLRGPKKVGWRECLCGCVPRGDQLCSYYPLRTSTEYKGTDSSMV